MLFQQPQSNIPGIVQAAQSFLYYILDIKRGGMQLSGDTPRDSGELTRKEEVTYNSALNVLNSYFNGEMTYADQQQVGSIDPEEPKNPVNV